MALLTRRGVGASLLLAAGLGKPAGAQAVALRPLSDILPSRPPADLPSVRLVTLEGASTTLADFAGRPVVLNFWATWCVPCVAELPELDRLAAGGGFAVLAASADRGGAGVVRAFAAAHAISHATLLLDSGNAAVQALGVVGFPTTFIIDAGGKLRGRLEGPASWGGAAGVLGKLVG